MPKKALSIFGLAAVVVIGGLAYSVLSDDEASTETLAPTTTADIQARNSNTIANNWQWSNLDNTSPAAEKSDVDKSRTASKAPYDVVEVYKVLQSIKVGEDGRLVPDQTALQALDRGFSDLGPNLSPEDMSELQQVIRKGLPGQAGEDAAHLLENYYRYRSAEVEFNEQLASQLPSTEHYKELVQLRRNYLGQEVADQLFAVEDTQARHMFATLAIEKNTSLTTEQKQAQQAVLQEQLNARLLALGQLKPEEAAAERVGRMREQGASSADIYSTRTAMLGAEGARELAAADREEAQWQSRFNGFWQARRYVMQAGLDEAERERQIEQLLNQYFSSDERERARVTSSEWQARDTT